MCGCVLGHGQDWHVLMHHKKRSFFFSWAVEVLLSIVCAVEREYGMAAHLGEHLVTWEGDHISKTRPDIYKRITRGLWLTDNAVEL